jgi:hypothetical protein
VWNVCNIQINTLVIYFWKTDGTLGTDACNIRVQPLQHMQHPDLFLQHPCEKHLKCTSKTSETFKMYTCNMHHIPVQPPPLSALGRHSRSRRARTDGLPRQVLGFSLCWRRLSTLSGRASGRARAVGRALRGAAGCFGGWGRGSDDDAKRGWVLEQEDWIGGDLWRPGFRAD